MKKSLPTQTIFLSTLSLRRATRDYNRNKRPVRHFYPRSPCGERRGAFCIKCHGITLFLSTLSLRRATKQAQKEYDEWRISIHALLAESDLHACMFRRAVLYFYPRSPCGERPMLPPFMLYLTHISIHALLAESDLLPPCFLPVNDISIHALLAESD